VWSLIAPIEDPWTFRWYPTLDEVKLGAAVWIEEPTGSAYEQPAAKLTPKATQLYSQWWQDDHILPTAPVRPEWQQQAERFWAERHRSELEEKDELPPRPVYPFHVLGPAADRFGFAVADDGSIDRESIRDEMSVPWLADGWARWLRGERPSGYGYWDRERPHWEPNTYPALAAALRLLAWPTLPRGTDTASGSGVVHPAEHDVDLLSELTRVTGTLAAKARSRLHWRGSPTVSVRWTIGDDGSLVSIAEADEESEQGDRLRYRLWRYTRRDAGSRGVTQDELQLLAEGRDPTRLKLWIRIGYQSGSSDAPARSPASTPTEPRGG